VSDLVGRTFLVTGANGGIGRVVSARLATRGARVVLGCRTVETAAATAVSQRGQGGSPALAFETLAVDLGDLASVRAAASSFLARGIALHGLINNAGLTTRRALSRDGIELTFAVNHLGPFLLTRLLEPALRAGAPSRVVNVASEAHRRVTGIDFSALRRPGSFSGFPEYAVSKLCNILFTRELARRWAGSGVTAYAVHPGVVATGIWRRLPRPLRWLATRSMLSPEEGARTVLTCATAPELGSVSGRYYKHDREALPRPVAEDDALAARLWTESEKLAGLS
jgi:NAD(P)-dependent dehydrogenase (short-subunit alcohol dehydrogenase family)